MNVLTYLNKRNRMGEATAIASICSAQPDVLRASLMLASDLERPILIEATSNQVNQFGGYTGMKPADFIAFVREIGIAIGMDYTLIGFGGDHLGPQVWRSEDAGSAMAKAEDLMRAYVAAGFTKIHLDCSEGCAGEPAQVNDTLSAARAARLAAICEASAPDPSRLTYVIGTEVPPPGGARADGAGQGITPTDPAHARKTLDAHLAAFERAGIAQVWPRVVGLVVQPGLEFSPTHIDHFDKAAPDDLSQALSHAPHICFEAHSTDYQRPDVFPELARRHFSILKVGPALTFAYRQALYSLDQLRGILQTGTQSLIAEMEQLMQEQPQHWQKHYVGCAEELRLQRHFGYADRIRYYWPEPKAQKAVANLISALGATRPATPALEQCFAPAIVGQAGALQEAGAHWAKALILSQVQNALRPYFF